MAKKLFLLLSVTLLSSALIGKTKVQIDMELDTLRSRIRQMTQKFKQNTGQVNQKELMAINAKYQQLVDAIKEHKA